MTGTPHVLSIDLGTGGPKVALVSMRGEVAARAVRAVETRLLPPDGAEQDPEEVWQAVASAVREVLGRAGAGVPVAGVSLASQYFSVVAVDREGQPLAGLVLWMDGRGGRHARALHAAHPEAGRRWLEIHGLLPLPSGADSLSHILWLREERPDVYARAHAFLEPADYVAARLTGRCTANPCTAFALLLTDNRDPGAVGWCDELVALAGVDPAKLPELVPVLSEIGPVRADVARALGLPRNVPVFSGLNDTQAVCVGTGAFGAGRGGVNVGTTSQVLAHVDHKCADLAREVMTMPGALPGRYAVLAENGIAGKALDHFLRRVVFARDGLADHAAGSDPFAGLGKALAETPPGAGGLLFLPWLTGSQSPQADPHVRGAFLNVSLDTTRAHMLRAVVEGVALSLRWLLPAVEDLAGGPFRELGFAGGAALSEPWAQVMADVLDRPLRQLADARHVINRATALLAFTRLGHASLDDHGLFCPVRCELEPRAELRELYRERLGAFLEAFERNRPVFARLNAAPAEPAPSPRREST
jgi:xylulokinase